jgi:hypothetical protein
MVSAPVASWRQSPFTRRLVLHRDTIARGHEVQPLTCVRAEVHPAERHRSHGPVSGFANATPPVH